NIGGIVRTLAASAPNVSTIGGSVTNFSGGQFIVEDGAALALTGGSGNSYNNAGDILLNSTGSNTELRAVGDVTIPGGTLTLSAGTKNHIVVANAGDRLTLSSLTVNGPGTLTNASALTLRFSTVNAPFVNQGALNVFGNVPINGSFT